MIKYEQINHNVRTTTAYTLATVKHKNIAQCLVSNIGVRQVRTSMCVLFAHVISFLPAADASETAQTIFTIVCFGDDSYTLSNSLFSSSFLSFAT